MPRDLGKTYVMVNIPDFTLRVMHDGKQVWTTRIVDRQAGHADADLLSETMKYITVNPTWNVPPSIVHNEYLPALQQDPTVLERMGLQGRATTATAPCTSRSRRATRNALGRIRFNFPNKFLVYQHDTPDKYLFAHDKRAYSHGCMRVQDPAEIRRGAARRSCAPNDGYTAERIQQDVRRRARATSSFPTCIPVHLTYQTAFVDDDGKLQFRDDVYGRDRQLLAILKGDERKVADVAGRAPGRPVAAPSPGDAGSTALFGDRGYGGCGTSYGGRRRQLLRAAVRRRFRRHAAGTGAPRRAASPADQFAEPPVQR